MRPSVLMSIYCVMVTKHSGVTDEPAGAEIQAALVAVADMVAVPVE